MNKNVNEKLLIQSGMDSKYTEKIKLKFDYEINNYLLDDKDPKSMTILKKNNEKVGFLENEKIIDELVEKFFRCKNISFYKKNCLKSFVSKQKVRFQNNKFDLDLVFITKRVIAMGFPAYGCEKLYRNSLSDVRKFCSEVLDNRVKVYNLCLEAHRVYDKTNFPDSKVALFPFSDHNACPVKLMLEFCVDISLYLLENQENKGLVHCKAGKGRTGVMICAYLIFSGLCKNTKEAIEVYGERRSHIKKGVTIPSQKRYIHHFETFLSCNFEKPYHKMIPKIIRQQIYPTENMLTNIFRDKSYYEYINLFKIKKIRVGPFEKLHYLTFKIFHFSKGILFDSSDTSEKRSFKISVKQDIVGNKIYNYSILEFSENFLVDCDIKLEIESKSINFFLWINMFYITLENFLIIINDYLTNSMPETSSHLRKNNLFDNAMSLLTYEPDSKMIELKDLKSVKKHITKKGFTNPLIDDSNKTDNLLKYRNCFDVNFYWKNDIVLNADKIKEFLRMNMKFLENIQLFDLNNIYSFFAKKNSEYFENSKKKFKIKFDAMGVDKFGLKKKMMEGFAIEISYILI